MELYLLVLTDTELSYDKHTEDFGIGVFRTKKEAENIAKYYLENVEGFCDYPCTYRIVEKEISDYIDDIDPTFVWVATGWNVNENFDETDIVESNFFVDKSHAEKELQELKNKYLRAEWSLDKWEIGKSSWKDGFVRC